MPRRRRTAPSIAAEALRAAEARAEGLAPLVQRERVVDGRGAVLREPIVEAAEWGDPDDLNPNARAPRRVSGYRRVDELRRLCEAGHVTEQQFKAGGRLLRDYELSDGSRPGCAVSGLRVDAVPSGPGAAQIDAARRYREAMRAVGQRAGSVLVMAVFGNASVSEVARHFGVRHYGALGLLQAALQRLVEHYGGSWEE